MKKKIEDYLHLYLGVNCRFKGQELKGKINQENLWKLFSVTQMDYGIQGTLFAMGCTKTLKAEEIYPILRPLSDIQPKEVANLIGVYDMAIEKANYESPFFQIQYRDENNELEYTHRYLTQLSPDQFLFLLSKHFDLFGLIESGLAIDKTTLNSKPPTP